MAFFRKKIQTSEIPATAAARDDAPQHAPGVSEHKRASAPRLASRRSLSDVLIRPRITEKGTIVSAHRAYAFNVAPWANKYEIAAAVRATYKVTPEKVTVARIPAKARFVRGKWGTKVGGKKAYIFLKQGEKIEFV
ncbi:MAG: 50S ribosomal protein L23 [bacterium]|nr:50S ribosomal protein L23 [bacterium]MDZ4284845.1 50S ribosomal protein L23 [Patescibacteria group bacterium]